MTSIMVIGGAGFIGSHVVDLLHKNPGNRLFIFDDLSTGSLSNIRPLISTRHNTRVRFELLDVRNWEHVKDAFHRFTPDVVVLLASLPRDSDPKLDMDVNVGGMLNVLRAAEMYATPRIIFASTSAVYRERWWGKLRESDVCNPKSPYGISKLAAENYLQALSHSESVILRLANVYGPRQPQGLVAGIFRHFKSGDEFYIRGDGKHKRDFVYVEDVAEAVQCGITGKPGVYNVGSGKRRTVLDITRALEEVYEVPGYAWEHRAEGDPRRDICLDVRRAAEGLNWVPRTKLMDGLKRTRDWWDLPQESSEPVRVPLAYEVVV